MAIKNKKGLAPTLIAELDSGSPIFSETRIEECDGWNPQCILPENYFDLALNRTGTRDLTPLSINSWDGREILSVVRKH